jgi:hypothetical protein
VRSPAATFLKQSFRGEEAMMRSESTKSGLGVVKVGPALMAALAVLAVGTLSASAAPLMVPALYGPFNPSTATDEVYFAGDVSNSDLLQQPGVTATHGAYMNSGMGDTPAGLNDGNAGGDFDAVGISALNGATWAKAGSESWSEYALGVGTGKGYDITGIQSIAAWQGAGFSNQKYDVLVKHLGDATFSHLVTVDYQPFSTALTEGGSTKVNVMDSTGVLASGVVAIKFAFMQINANPAGGTVMREMDVFGTPTPEPTTMVLLGLGGLLAWRRRK